MQQIQQYLRPDWTGVYFTADAEREPFEDVVIKTTRSKFLEIAMEAAADYLHRNGQTLTPELVNVAAVTLIAAKKVFVQEQVKVDETGIEVLVDVPSVERDDCLWRALDLVGQALDALDGKQGTIYFGEPLQYTLLDAQQSGS